VAREDSSQPSPGERKNEREKVRERHDKGELSGEEYERARERLRRF